MNRDSVILGVRHFRRLLQLLPVLLSLHSATSLADAGRSREMVTYGAVKIEVIAEGRGPLIVLLPSSTRDSEDYDAVAERIAAAGFRVLRPQPRGMGKSSGPMEDLNLHALADDIAAVIRQQNAGPAILAGHAFGHYVARVTDMDHPQLVRGVVVAAAAARRFDPALRVSLTASANAALPDEERLKHLKIAFFAPGNDASEWLKGWHTHLTAVYAKAANNPPRETWWPVARAPILDLQAANDPWRPRSTVNELADAFGDKVTVKVIANASHALIPEQPTAVADAIVEWARGLKP